MEIPVLLEPTASGFRASTQSPVPLSADGSTEAAAMEALSDVLKNRLRNGAQLRSLRTPNEESLDEIHQRMILNTLYSEFLGSIEEYRKVANAVLPSPLPPPAAGRGWCPTPHPREAGYRR
jgi:hypothetical protein